MTEFYTVGYRTGQYLALTGKTKIRDYLHLVWGDFECCCEENHQKINPISYREFIRGVLRGYRGM